jgi:hypothetical protein
MKLRPASFLFLLSILTYALLSWALGFYWDEFPMTWIFFRLGPEALAKYFSTNRPFWGMIYQLTLPLVGPNPIAWQLIAVLLRWISAVLLHQILRLTFPRQPRLAIIVAALFLVYPGFGQHFISMMYSHFYIVLNIFLLSLYLSLLAIKRPILHIPALLLALLNVLTMEYFYFLEFVRIALFFIALERDKKRTALFSSPYLILFISVTIWRAFFFPYQTTNYKYVALEALKANPIMGMMKLLESILLSFWESVLHAWLSLFSPDFSALGLATVTVTVILALAAAALTFFFLLPSSSYGRPKTDDSDLPSADYWSLITLGFFAWLLGGGQFWLVGILPKIDFNGDRFNLSFMLGASLLLAALILSLQKWPRIQYGIFAVIIGLAVGRQFILANAYRRDWDMQRNLFWQMTWRMPSLRPGTAVITNDLPVTFYSDNSLSAPLNWIYGPSGKMDYILYFASVRIAEGRAMEQGFVPNLPIEQDYLAAMFHGNTSNMVVLNFSPPGCLRILDPEIDPLNKLIPPDLRDAAFLSNPGMVGVEASATLPEQFYGSEPHQSWCYYFEKADLDRQLGYWPEVASIGDAAYALGDRPNDPLEHFVFIEGYAHVENWNRARELTKESYRFSKDVMRPMLCALWTRISEQTADSAAKQAAVSQIRDEIKCQP